MQLDRLQEKLPEVIIDWYMKAGIQSTIKNIGSRREGLTLVVRLANAIHTWRYVESEPSADGRIKPLPDWDLEIVNKRGTLSQVSSAAAERRSMPRMPGIAISELAIEANGAIFPATACNISTKGVGLLTQCQVGVATIITIKRGDDSRDLTRPLTAEVRRTTPLPKGEWIVGCAFSRDLNAEDLLELGKRRSIDW